MFIDENFGVFRTPIMILGVRFGDANVHILRLINRASIVVIGVTNIKALYHNMEKISIFSLIYMLKKLVKKLVLLIFS